MADCKYKDIPDPETCSIEQALIWWARRETPINSRLIAEKLNRKPGFYDFDISDIYAFFELCAERVRFIGRPVLNITNISLRDGHFRVDHDGVSFDYEEIPIDRIQFAALYYTGGMFENYGITNRSVLLYPEMIDEIRLRDPEFVAENPSYIPSFFWAYRCVEIDFKDLKALFPPEITEPPTATAVIDPPKHPVSDSGSTTAGNAPSTQDEHRAWLDSSGYDANGARKIKKTIEPDFMKRFPGTSVRAWNDAFGTWAGTKGKKHRPKVNEKVNK